MITFSKKDYAERFSALREKLSPKEVFLVNSGANMRYLTGFNSGRMIVSKETATYWLNEAYSGLSKDAPLEATPYSKDCIKNAIFALNPKSILIDEMSFPTYEYSDSKLKGLYKSSEILTDLRMIKSEKETELIRESGKLAAEVIKAAEEMTLIGMNEFELAGELEGMIRKGGSEWPPFESGMLCLAGPNTRYIHAPPSERKIKGGDLVVLDIGASIGGYHSDMTRTLKIGNISEPASELRDFVMDLEASCIERCEIGGKISEVHKYAEEQIEAYGQKFYHLLGHGVGLNIHESPSIGPDCELVFKEGMVFTIEPGIYTSEIGARFEDTITFKDGKKEILTK